MTKLVGPTMLEEQNLLVKPIDSVPNDRGKAELVSGTLLCEKIF